MVYRIEERDEAALRARARGAARAVPRYQAPRPAAPRPPAPRSPAPPAYGDPYGPQRGGYDGGREIQERGYGQGDYPRAEEDFPPYSPGGRQGGYQQPRSGIRPPTKPLVHYKPVEAPRLQRPNRPSAATDPRMASTAFDGIRSTVVQGTYDPRYEDEQLANIRGARIDDPAAIAGTDLSRARGAADAARREVGGIRAGSERQIAGTNLSRARSAVDRMRQQIEQAQMTRRGAVAGTDQRGARAQLGQANNLAGQLQRLSGQEIAAGTYDPSAYAERARELTAGQLENLLDAPDRGELALRTLALEEQRAQPAFQQRMRQIAQRAAALGRTRSGMTTNDLTGLEQDYRNRQDQMRESLLINAGNQTLQDRLATLGAAQSVAGQFRGEDVTEAGLQQALRDEARGERGQRAGLLGGALDARRALSSDNLNLDRLRRTEGLEERDFAAGQDQAQAQLALARAGAMGDVAGREEGFANIARRDQESDRDYAARQEIARMQAAAARAQELRALTGTEADLAGITRRDAESDRATALQVAQANAGLGLDRARLLGGMDAQRFGAESQLRDETRGEREYGNRMAQQEIENRQRQMMLEEQLMDAELNRNIRLAESQAALGNNSAQINALMAAIQQGGPGSEQALQLLMQMLATQQAARG